MSNKTGFKVCAGAMCLCNFGKAPAKLKVLAQKKHYINDPEGTEKLLATHKEIGQPFEPPFFGSCSKMNNSPCVVNVSEWSNYYTNETYENGGHPLLDSSKATCAVGAKDCISISWHGQSATPTLNNANKDVQSTLNPLTKIKQVLDISWKYGDEDASLKDQSKHSADLNLHVKTTGYKAGEVVEITIFYEDGSQVLEDEKEVNYTGVVNAKGLVILKEVFKNKTVNIYYEA